MTTPEIPKNELLWVQYYDGNHERIAYVTSNKLRTEYYLYENVEGAWAKTHQAEDPTGLEQFIKILEGCEDA